MAKDRQLLTYEWERRIKVQLSLSHVLLQELRRALFTVRTKKTIEQMEARLQTSAEVSRMDLEEYRRSISACQQELEQIEAHCVQAKEEAELFRREFEEFKSKWNNEQQE